MPAPAHRGGPELARAEGPPPVNAPARRFWWAWAILLAVAGGLVAALTYTPPLAGPFRLELEFAAGAPGQTVPIIVTGEAGNGDFLYARYRDAGTVAIGYDWWGIAGPISEPIEIKPGTRHELTVEMPTAAQTWTNFAAGSRMLRVTCDGQELFRAELPLRVRLPECLYIGTNPIGPAYGPAFVGKIFDARGRELRGGVESIFTRGDRVRGWLHYGWPQIAGVLIAGALVGSLGLLPWRIAGAAGAAWLREHHWFAVTAAGCAVGFTWVLTGGTWRLNYPDAFGQFYDAQALSLLGGRLDVPQAAVAGEEFVVGGKYFGYFGITPALQRWPVAIFGLRPGEWTRVAMLAEYLLALIAAYLVLVEIRRQLTGRRGAPGAGTAVVFTLHAGLGSTLFFLGSRAYVYHEATLCGAAWALVAAYGTLRYWAAPASRWWIAAGAAGLLSMHARPSVGLFALALPGIAALLLAGRAGWSGAGRRHLGVAALAVGGVLSFNGLSYLKFGSFDGAPLRYSVLYSSDPARLAHLGGSNFHLGNLAYNFRTYAWQPSVSLHRSFPYFKLESLPPDQFPKAVLDIAEPTLAVTYAMPGLTLLAVLGALGAGIAVRAARPRLILFTGASAPLAAAMLTAVAVSHRYTADFVPSLLTLAALALAALELAPRWGRRLGLALIALLTAWAVLLTLGITLHYQNEEVWGTPEETKQHYQALRSLLDGWWGFRR
jgi:hypothetical protein